MTYNKPLPKINADTKEFWEGCREHLIKIQKCADCGFVRWPPSFICPQCHSQKTDWIASTGRGSVYTFVVNHIAYHPAFRENLPYVVAVVELDEGPHLLTNIVDCDPGEVLCDMPVEVVWDDITDEFSLPKFRPVS
ncbi:MAG: Zn-ribbon domain-containing OB-fold protein [Deltaproteobacteria bacterium]|nr:Zn-ribbon domain-containing OB-fold protein [Deltaproteobacteria bacterium]MBW2594913.1 Zn-ribbon domain-containing OB-fold protein [Deltaproteobacteria bacterium]MBW2650317.1 Zn-ribbon domain-containing OB-fold protein [Deltaproteobacteria bacterium]